MKTEDRPEKIMARIRLLRLSTGKFLFTFSDDQFSRKREQSSKMGMDKTLL